MSTITVDMLDSACEEPRDLFVTLFGEQVEVTEDLCVKHADKFDWSWASKHLLTEPSVAEYRRVTAQAWDAYKRETAWAFTEYERVQAATFARLFIAKGVAA
jgi:hypothetical protein